MMRTHPLWRAIAPMTPDERARARVGGGARKPVAVVAPDQDWPRQFVVVRDLLVAVLGSRVLDVLHIGSTSVPGMWAKPIIDVDLTVADSAREPDYLPDLEAAGFTLRVREPDWEGHRLVTWPEPNANVHVWSPGATEPPRHLAFARWLATHDDDHAAYAELKRRLAERGLQDSMDYNNAKCSLVYAIYERIFAADEIHAHDPHPRR